MSVAGAKVPAIISVGIICFALGVGAGGMGMMYFGYKVTAEPPPTGGAPQSPRAQGGGPTMMPPGFGGGFGRQSPKMQLATLVNTLDRLTEKPLQVNLTSEERTKVLEQLKGLDAEKELSDEEAGKRLTEILGTIRDHQSTMESAGYRWPGSRPGGGGGGGGAGGAGGGRGGRPPEPPANPFAEGDTSKHYKALQDRLAKAK
jgi:hypothetical protein